MNAHTYGTKESGEESWVKRLYLYTGTNVYLEAMDTVKDETDRTYVMSLEGYFRFLMSDFPMLRKCLQSVYQKVLISIVFSSRGARFIK
jgi:hypothetical protein